MQNKTIATWLFVSGILTIASALLGMNSEFIGLCATTYLVFGFVAAVRLNKPIQ